MDLLSDVEDNRHRDLLATGVVPGVKEARFLEESIKRQDTAILDLDSQISYLELELEKARNGLEELRARRLALSWSSAVKKALLAPMRKIATEILSEIFKCCVRVATNDDLGDITPDTAPLLLLHICKRWRNVALGTPPIWTILSLQGKLKVNPIVIIPMWLQLSRGLPISIYINTTLWWPRHVPMSAFSSISKHLHRCRVFHYTGSAELFGAIFPSGGHITVPVLQDFRVSGFSPEDLIPGFRITAPNLRSLDILNLHFVLDLQPSNFLHLRSLCLAWKSTAKDEFIRLLGILHTPALESFSLEHIWGTYPDPGVGPAVQHFLSLSAPVLKELILLNVRLPSGEVVSLLGVLPFLERLTLDNVTDIIDFVSALTPSLITHPRAWPLPRLSSLCLRHVELMHAPLDSMVEGRASPHPSITSVSEAFTQLAYIEVMGCDLSCFQQARLKQLARNLDGFSIHGLQTSRIRKDHLVED